MLSSQFKRKFWEIFALNPRLCKTRFKKSSRIKKNRLNKTNFYENWEERAKKCHYHFISKKKNSLSNDTQIFFFSSLFLSSSCEISPNFSKKFPNTHYFSAKAICSCASAIFDIVRLYILIDKKWLENKNVDFSVQQWNEKKSIIFLHSLLLENFKLNLQLPDFI